LVRSSSVSSGSALTAGRDRHVAADEEGEPSEHLLLADIGLAGDQLTNAVGEIIVVRHARIIVYERRRCLAGPALDEPGVWI
jgi:hypothetical protein